MLMLISRFDTQNLMLSILFFKFKFQVIAGNPVTIEFLKSQNTEIVNNVVAKYISFLANAIWLSLGYKVCRKTTSQVVKIPCCYKILKLRL
jgi:hypothetical protein